MGKMRRLLRLSVGATAGVASYGAYMKNINPEQWKWYAIISLLCFASIVFNNLKKDNLLYMFILGVAFTVFGGNPEFASSAIMRTALYVGVCLTAITTYKDFVGDKSAKGN